MTPKELVVEAMRRQDAGDTDGFIAMQGEDCVWHVPGGATLTGRDEIRAWVEPFTVAFPEPHHDFTRLIEDGDTVYCEGVFHGIQAGPLATPQGEIPATGKRVEFRFALVVTGDVEQNQSREVSVYFDQLEFLIQLGVLPEPALA
jgi:predicted ester cyclase